MNKSPAEIKAEILRLTREYSALMHRANRPAWDSPAPFEPGKSTIPYAGRIFDEDEVEAAVSSTLDFWLTLGPEGEAFEKELAAFLGARFSLLVNSGSSANLIAISALTTHKLPTDRRILRGDEVITVAAGFPTTVAPIVQVGAVPVFIDNDPVTGNARAEMLEAAYVEGKTKAVIMAHTLGNPFDIGNVLEFCRRHNLWLIEDNCDSLGSTYTMPLHRAQSLELDHLLKIAQTGTHSIIRIHDRFGVTRVGRDIAAEPDGAELFLTAPTGSWGDLSTQSFYPPHHLTLGEGGSVNIISKAALKTYAESFRDWGRDCWCASGKDNTCGRRFDWKLGELPRGYDHKYIYSHLGYNLKPLDIQAAIGRQQLRKLPSFIEARRRNWQILRQGLQPAADFLEFSLPTHATEWTAGQLDDRKASSQLGHCDDSGFAWDSSGFRACPSWFGFMVRVKEHELIGARDLAAYLDSRKVGNRMLFGGNLVRQPAFVQLERDYPNSYRIVGDLKGADQIMRTTVFLGTYPGATTGMLEFVCSALLELVSEWRGKMNGV